VTSASWQTNKTDFVTPCTSWSNKTGVDCRCNALPIKFPRKEFYMKMISTLLATLLLGTSAVAFAQDAPPPGDKGPRHDPMKAMDCGKAPADMKDRCEMRNKALETCKDKAEDRKAHRECMMAQRPKKDDKPEEKK
jgi:hypothetical protein